MSRQAWYTLIALAVLAGSTFALAQKGSPGRSSNSRSNVNATSSTGGTTTARRRNRDSLPMALTSSRKAAALEFARQHHPELANLLKGLEKRNRRAYVRAMAQLYSTSERLARSKERFSPERFELELEAWKLDSRIRLLAARVSLSRKKDVRLERELNQALAERIDVRVRQLRREKVRLLQRADKLDKTILSLDAERDKAAAQYLKRVNRGLGIKPRKNRSASRKAAKRKSKKSTGSSKRTKDNE